MTYVKPTDARMTAMRAVRAAQRTKLAAIDAVWKAHDSKCAVCKHPLLKPGVAQDVDTVGYVRGTRLLCGRHFYRRDQIIDTPRLIITKMY